MPLPGAKVVKKDNNTDDKPKKKTADKKVERPNVEVAVSGSNQNNPKDGQVASFETQTKVSSSLIQDKELKQSIKKRKKRKSSKSKTRFTEK